MKSLELISDRKDFLDGVINDLVVGNLIPYGLQGKNQDETRARVRIAVYYGITLGFNPFQAVNNVGVVNNKPTVYGPAVPAMIQTDPDCKWMGLPEYELDANGFPVSCTISFERKSVGKPESFTVYMSDFMHLYNRTSKNPDKDAWKTSTKDMLSYKAYHRILSFAFSSRFAGVRIAENERDIPQEPPVEVKYEEVVTQELSPPPPIAPNKAKADPPPQPAQEEFKQKPKERAKKEKETVSEEKDDKDVQFAAMIEENIRFIPEDKLEEFKSATTSEARNKIYKDIQSVKEFHSMIEAEDSEARGPVFQMIYNSTEVDLNVPAINSLLG